MARNIIACFALFVSVLALQVPFPSPGIDMDQRGTSAGTSIAAGTATASASAPPQHLFDDGALEAVAMLALAGMDALFIAAAVIHRRHTQHAAVGAGGGGGGGNWRRDAELAFFVLCLQVGALQFVLLEPAAAVDAAARALWIGTSAAARALPFVASATFFLGITLIYAHAHMDMGNRGGAVAGNGPVPSAPAPATIRLLANMTLGAALVCLMAIVLALFYINTK